MKKLFLIIAMLVAMPVSAVQVSTDMARIITSHGRPVDCLAPIAVNKIDGEMKIVPAQGFEIEPGVHTLNGRAVLDTNSCPAGRGGNRGGHAADLEVNFEAGKTYYIGYDHKAHNRDEWKLVVWKVE